ncbi:hypothetical protein EIP86_004190 [Pleurotus ostreatoroseus]|nr:hypothetical protein EIP86_004190 [Pleurotus ostreatoroseus]
MSSGQTAQNKTWKSREQGEEAQYVHAKEQEQLAALRESLQKQEEDKQKSSQPQSERDRDFEGGFGGQEDLEDRYVIIATHPFPRVGTMLTAMLALRYATTSGEH